ncbi:protein indeterminate-domain 5, chloroplastic-like [Oryza brachyantha]|uniref:protein indeterminate-domain 5, chloroplastic-like n=1 Tax=Oryza brachyantha TaxID=4533 RepID=UPI001AD9CEEB|nr:protein indeterminate-domain 5, chloroplastic-like [Oryza brachyantha]XP_040382885.1 protein indeterminate-domain 5, chloroplastic-like [Oryza brachyantha]XP_040382886.1 protein indeterminate-domain 5, chloroplastic-like [Oryza brachyantha]XP_040382887.1 protein indeterminate-domain 5, chloroplastic-like [Oryza brachyantha]
MAAASAHYFGLSEPAQMQQQQQQQQAHLQSNAAAPPAAATPPPKKKRNQPGNPNPDAEVIALSPHTLLATNRFVCEVCNKGFQREQNLQLHRRGHNLPWKLKQKNPKETRRRVYLCPEPSCVHHDPSRALGDLTGIKKHYCRKHGEKKWKCDKCNKRYAVQSDWKAHSKTCGTREYRCDCGTLFSRRDSFITHRAFCDALAQESGRMPPMAGTALYGAGSLAAIGLAGMAAPQLQSFQDQTPHSSAITGGNAATQFDHLMAPSSAASPAFRATQPASSASSPFYLGSGADDGQTHTSLLHGKPGFHGLMQLPEQHQPAGNNGLLNLSYFSGANGGGHQDARLIYPEQFNGAGAGNGRPGSGGQHGNSGANTDSASIFSGNMMGGGFSSLYSSSDQSVAPPQMSATALLQKAAQMGATTSSGGGAGSVNTLLKGLGSGGALNGKAAGFIMSGESSSRSTSQTAENESQLRDLMMNAGTVFVGGGFPGVDDGKLSTRDFLGMNGGAAGLALRHSTAGMGMGSLDQEMK